MRLKSSAALALCSILLLVAAPRARSNGSEVEVEIRPCTLNLKGGGGWVMAAIFLPEEATFDIESDAVWLETVEASWTRLTKHSLMAFFDRSAVIDCLQNAGVTGGAEVELCVYGYSGASVTMCPCCGAHVPPNIGTCPECGSPLPTQLVFWGCDTVRVMGEAG